ncbi:MAG TPA: FdtA/QdtA family cupin domain-containing protein [Sphingobacteriaceae bacterium]
METDLQYSQNLLSTLRDVRVIDLPKIHDPRGNLSFIEENNQIPFTIKRTYWTYDVPGGENRGCHAYIKSCEFIVALSGSFDICIHDGKQEQRFSLNRSYYGIYVPQMLWRRIENFSTNSLALVLASTPYKESDYIRDFQTFLISKERWKDRQAMFTSVQ